MPRAVWSTALHLWHLTLVVGFGLTSLVPLTPLGSSSGGAWVWLQPTALALLIALSLIAFGISVWHRLRPVRHLAPLLGAFSVAQGALSLVMHGPGYFGVASILFAVVICVVGMVLARRCVPKQTQPPQVSATNTHDGAHE